EAMSVTTASIVSAVLTLLPVLAAVAQCPPNFQRLSTGVQCYTNEYCSSLAAGYTCENNVCCSRTQRDSFCPIDQVSVNGVCYGMVNLNEPCAYSQQCRGVNMQCLNGFCRGGNEMIGSCQNPNDVLERNMQTQQLKNCLEEPCSQGFVCEYTSASRYQCCGQYTRNIDYNYDSDASICLRVEDVVNSTFLS
ncbi:hypothetical protein PENTCL1PPCAC_1007, partial [Pristionchus entomophagus]